MSSTYAVGDEMTLQAIARDAASTDPAQDGAGIVPMWLRGRPGRKRVQLLVMTAYGWQTVADFHDVASAMLFRDVLLDAVGATLRGDTVELMMSGLEAAE